MEEEKFNESANAGSINKSPAMRNTVTVSEIDPAKLKFLLWDIDGTLLQSTRPGGFRDYFGTSLEKIFGTQGRISEVKAAGATDLQIVYEALKNDGFTIEQITGRMNEFVEVLRTEMQNYLDRNEEVYEILPGVKKILQATDENPQFINALLTGNVECGAELKCVYVGIWQYFEKSLNTYGDVSHDRKHLAIEAGKNYNEYYRIALKPAQFIVIGDTPHDIATAKNFGAKVLSVETGRGISYEDLKVKQPDALIADLRDTERVLEIFETI